jgi:hypothetical protein
MWPAPGGDHQGTAVCNCGHRAAGGRGSRGLSSWTTGVSPSPRRRQHLDLRVAHPGYICNGKVTGTRSGPTPCRPAGRASPPVMTGRSHGRTPSRSWRRGPVASASPSRPPPKQRKSASGRLRRPSPILLMPTLSAGDETVNVVSPVVRAPGCEQPAQGNCRRLRGWCAGCEFHHDQPHHAMAPGCRGPRLGVIGAGRGRPDDWPPAEPVVMPSADRRATPRAVGPSPAPQ